jgi:hypothetical protein
MKGAVQMRMKRVLGKGLGDAKVLGYSELGSFEEWKDLGENLGWRVVGFVMECEGRASQARGGIWVLPSVRSANESVCECMQRM